MTIIHSIKLAAVAMAAVSFTSCGGHGLRNIGNSLIDAGNSMQGINNHGGGALPYNNTYSSMPQNGSWQNSQFEHDYNFYTELYNQERARVNKALYGPY